MSKNYCYDEKFDDDFDRVMQFFPEYRFYNKHLKEYDIGHMAVRNFMIAIQEGNIEQVRTIFEALDPQQKLGILSLDFDYGALDRCGGSGTPIQLAQMYSSRNSEIAPYLIMQKKSLDSRALGALIGALNHLVIVNDKKQEQQVFTVVVCNNLSFFLTPKDVVALMQTCKYARSMTRRNEKEREKAAVRVLTSIAKGAAARKEVAVALLVAPQEKEEAERELELSR